MNRAEMLREIRMARFEEIYDRGRRKRVTQAWAASVLGVTDRTFRRWVARYEAGGLAALKDKRVAGPSPRRASPEEVADPDLEDLLGRPALHPAAAVGSAGVVGLQVSIQVLLHLRNRLVPGRPALDAKMLFEVGAVETFGV